jgi:hypothetical protein
MTFGISETDFHLGLGRATDTGREWIIRLDTVLGNIGPDEVAWDPQTVPHGDSSQAVTAEPDTGYHFVQWNDGSTANPRIDENVISDISVTAVFDYVKGDVNFDGKVSMKDAVLLIQYAAGLADLTDAQKKRGNITGHEDDNHVGMADAIQIFGIMARRPLLEHREIEYQHTDPID